MPPFAVLYEDNHLLVVAKPAGLLAQADRTGDADLVALAKDYRRRHEDKPGNAFVGLCHRLDRPVSGVTVLAKTSKAAARLAEQFRSRQVQKTYLAAVGGGPPPGTAGEWRSFLTKDEATNTVRSSAVPGTGGAEAVTAWRCVAADGPHRLLELLPETGRPHQLRVHCAVFAGPIIGDRRYGTAGPPGWPAHAIALHAAAVTLLHPTRREPLTVRCPLPGYWRAALGPLAAGVA